MKSMLLKKKPPKRPKWDKLETQNAAQTRTTSENSAQTRTTCKAGKRVGKLRLAKKKFGFIEICEIPKARETYTSALHRKDRNIVQTTLLACFVRKARYGEKWVEKIGIR